ncbi:AAA family ATPase [Candidatus Binatia bacterium]|nr:AAA family ATPase [Candidatus Binatia bacterium]
MPIPDSSAPDLIAFPPFELDLRAGLLRRASTPIPLRPKTFAVLEHLAQHPGELVGKRALLDSVWADVVVTEDVVRLSIRELRVALADDPAAPRFIETVPRRGYRFVATMGSPRTDALEPARAIPKVASGTVVGRTRERAEIADAYRAALTGRRQIVLVSGEAGIGKTTLVEAALADLTHATDRPPAVARGQCVEQYGGGEPFLPIVEALAELGRGAHARRVESVLVAQAPDWLLRALKIGPPGGAGDTASTPEHSLHRLATTLEVLSGEIPLVLVLEDLHWCDRATLDLLSVLAQRREPTQLLLLGTLRPVDAIAHGHPVAAVRRELLRKSLCRQVLLGGLSAAGVADYLAARFPDGTLPSGLLPLLVERSGGNPFILVTLVDHLLASELLVHGTPWELRAPLDTLRATIPSQVRAIIEPRLERLGDDARRVLERGSVAGLEFAAQVVADVATHDEDLADVELVEQICDALAVRHEILRNAGESTWPDGTTSSRYAFAHALYRDVIHQALPSATRRRLHQSIGERLERAHAGRTADVASELAVHFERSGDRARAARFHGEAAAHARSRFAYQEAREHLEAALAWQRDLPDGGDHRRREALLLQALGATLFSINGHDDEDAACAFARMGELAERLDDDVLQLRAMDGLLLGHAMRGELDAAHGLAERMIEQADRETNAVASVNTRMTLAAVVYHLGDLASAHRLAQQVREVSDGDARQLSRTLGMSSRCLLSWTHALLGRPAEARVLLHAAVERGTALAIPYSRAQSTNMAARGCALLRDVAATRALAADSVRLADEFGFAMFRIEGTLLLGWCDAVDGRADGLATVREMFRAYAATRQRISATTYGTLVADAHLAHGDAESARSALQEASALADTTGERVNDPELQRLLGECVLVRASRRAQRDEATRCFEQALVLAEQRDAQLFALRAATSLLRLRGDPERERAAAVLARFAAHEDCSDVRAARTLLAG